MAKVIAYAKPEQTPGYIKSETIRQDKRGQLFHVVNFGGGRYFRKKISKEEFAKMTKPTRKDWSPRWVHRTGSPKPRRKSLAAQLLR